MKRCGITQLGWSQRGGRCLISFWPSYTCHIHVAEREDKNQPPNKEETNWAKRTQRTQRIHQDCNLRSWKDTISCASILEVLVMPLTWKQFAATVLAEAGFGQVGSNFLHLNITNLDEVQRHSRSSISKFDPRTTILP